MSIIIDAKERFVFRQVLSKGPIELYRQYQAIGDETGELICEKSLPYLKAFVNYPGDLCEGIIRAEKREWLSLKPWGEEYLFLLTVISAYYCDKKAFTTGLLWSKKALDLLYYFFRTREESDVRDTLQEMPAITILGTLRNHFNNELYDRFFLDWEVDGFYYSGNILHFNDN